MKVALLVPGGVFLATQIVAYEPAFKQAYDAGRPHVVSTSLPAGDTAVVAPDLHEIVVHFDRPVRPHRYAVVPLFVDGCRSRRRP